MSGNKILDELVSAETSLAFRAVYHGIRKVGHVPGSFPCLVVLENGRIKPHHVVMQLGHELPPCILDVSFEFHAQRTVVPGACLTAVDFARLIHKAAALAQADNLVKRA